MQIYQVLLSDDSKDVRYARTLAGVRDIVKMELPVFRPGVLVREITVATDKAAIVIMLDDPVAVRDALRCEQSVREWRGTKRGGLMLTKAAPKRRATANVDDDAEPGGLSRAHGRDE